MTRSLTTTGIDINFHGTEVSGCKAGNRGGAFFVKDMNLNLAGARFRNNSAVASGGAIALEGGFTAQIRRSRCAALLRTPSEHP